MPLGLLEKPRMLAHSLLSRPMYLTLFKENPTENDVKGRELSGKGYSMQLVNFAVEGTAVKNTNEIKFSVADGDWDTITYVGLRDKFGSLLFWYDKLEKPIYIRAGDQLTIAPKNLNVSVD
ncbi:phage tail fiber protein [Pseudoneobacillus rhizosphaerae]|uniref:Uncharacterized protein n=1 Tax=Pseudoneobacillus rhizosphaerae TaxID=2880968 RepID=A0A9C7G9H5_9BACI|nr:hypothetical protein [Pseudoneobacillus rhizosphaerae]CAG9608063.1 hypothetical protein NEOCIP111885_01755 [Pseudoneobacillus rhizosphaerae]